MKINNPVQSFWISQEFSLMEILCINSYLANGHEFHLYVYQDFPDIPKGAVIKDANRIIPEKEVILDRFGSYAHFADRFRFKLLYESGGWWVDMDTVCLKPFDFDEDFVFSSEISDYNRRRYSVNNTFIKSKPGVKFLKDCLDFITARGYEHIHWGEFGVNLFSRMIFRNNLEQYIKQPECFCPVTYYDFDSITGETPFHFPENSYALHWWNDVWRRKGIDKNAKFPENSLYEVMKRKYN